jgi:hypothetical protein
MSREATASELARQCYDDLWLGHPSDQVGREIEQIVLPPGIPLGGSAALAVRRHAFARQGSEHVILWRS